MKREPVTHSQLRSLNTCLRKHQIMYELQLRPCTDAAPLRIGSAVHKGLDIKAAGKSWEEAVTTVHEDYAAYEPTLTVERAQEIAYEHAMVAELLTLYFWYWQEADSNIKVVHTELPFKIPVRNPSTGRAGRIPYAGKIDKIIEVNGELAIMEHKTTSETLSPDNDYFRRLRIDTQIGLYFMAAQELGYDVRTVLYDVIRKPQLKPSLVPVLDHEGKKVVWDAAGQRVYNANGEPRQTSDTEKGYTLHTRTETPQEYAARVRKAIMDDPSKYFARVWVPRIEKDIQESKQLLWDQTQRLAYHRKCASWPRNTDACIGFSRCTCFDLCSNSFDPASGVIPDGWQRVTNNHTELEV